MTAPVPPADAYVPIEMRWKLVRPGDVVLDPNGAPWMVTARPHTVQGLAEPAVTVARGSEVFTRYRDPEQTVRVLVPWPEAAGVVVLREGLGPVRVLDRGEVA